jgi:hypothetical protein
MSVMNETDPIPSQRLSSFRFSWHWALAGWLSTFVAFGLGDAASPSSSIPSSLAQSRTRPPIPPPPLQQFLDLLTSNPAERARLLEGKSPESKSLILRRLREYESLTPTQREQRLIQLRLAQFRFYLSPLLRAEPADRSSILEAVPDADREILVERLDAWDKLPDSVRAEVLESDRQFHYFVRHQSADPKRLDEVLAVVPPRAQHHVERQFKRWAALTSEERALRTSRFQRFFDLSQPEREGALNALSANDRKLMERSLEQYSKLPEEKQQKVIQGFTKFAGLTRAEQQEFLANAARWEAMTSEERTAWRRLVLNIPAVPPLPPISLPGTGQPGLVITNR